MVGQVLELNSERHARILREKLQEKTDEVTQVARRFDVTKGQAETYYEKYKGDLDK